MLSAKDILKRLRRRQADVVGLDFGGRYTAAVRMKKGTAGSPVVTAAALLETPVGTESSGDGSPMYIRPPLPSRLNARYAALSISGRKTLIKLLSFPGRFDAAAEERVPENLAVDDPAAYRIAFRVVREGSAKAESRVLAVALAEAEAQAVLSLFATGLPAPFSIEVSVLAATTAFAHGPLARDGELSLGVIEFGEAMTLVSFFHRGALVLVRQFQVGAGTVVDSVAKALGVDAATAHGILADEAFDVSQPVMAVLSPLVKQVVVSRDFVERREDCRIQKLFVSGGVLNSRGFVRELTTALEVEIATWNPFEGLTVNADALPPELAGQEWRFAAAAGACLATFEEE
jgi:Tfp pilus assembly PilM family ATPase